jgi:DNA repair exonuclease SbcCD ATPase subunit
MAENKTEESISKGEYDALFEKLTKVEELFKEQIPSASQADFDKMSNTMDELKGQVDELAPTIQKMAEAEKPDLVEKSTVDELAKKLEDVQKHVETIENMPMMKGIQDVGDGKPQKLDVMKGIFHTAFPEAGGK